MARYFLDSSALVKRYHLESGSAEVQSLLDRSGNRFLISRLALVEIQSSFVRLLREGILEDVDFDQATSRLNGDVSSGLLAVAAVTSRRLDEAAVILSRIGRTSPLRTLDAIHLATAQVLQSRGQLAAFVAADKRLLAAAPACGLTTLEIG